MSENTATVPAPENAAGNSLGETPAIPVNPANLTDSLISGMPTPPSEPRPAPVFVTEEPKLPDPGAGVLPGFEIKDDAGTVFNPAEHAADENGNPKKNAKGRFYSKFIGRGGAAKKAAAGGNPAPVVAANRPLPKFEGAPENNRIPTQEQVDAVISDARPAGEQAPDPAEGVALMIIPTVDGIAQSLLGPDVALTENDVKAAHPAVTAFLRAKNMKDLSPGWALVAVAAAIYLPKLSKPTVKERLTLIYLKIRGFLGMGGK